jgi:hypothetical protein
VLAGKPVSRPVTEVVGFPITRPAKARPEAADGERVTYCRQVARILQANCQTCHWPGEAGPFPQMTYQDAADWATAIGEAVRERRMPPWHADPAHGTFANDRRLSDADRACLQAWLDQGCPEGNPADLPAPRRYTPGWCIGQPDEVITMNKEIQVPAQAPRGGLPYKYVLAGKPFAQERWVCAAEVRPGDHSLVHHVNVYVQRPGKKALPPGDELDECTFCGSGVPTALRAAQPTGAVCHDRRETRPLSLDRQDRRGRDGRCPTSWCWIPKSTQTPAARPPRAPR